MFVCEMPWTEDYNPDAPNVVWDSHGRHFVGLVGMVVGGEQRRYKLLVQTIKRYTCFELKFHFFGPKWAVDEYLEHSAYKYRLGLEDENEAFVEHARYTWGVVLSSPQFRRFSIWGGDLKWHQYSDAEDAYVILQCKFFDEKRWDEDDEIRGFKLKRVGEHGECDLTLEDYETTQEIDWSDAEDDTHPME